MLGSLRGNGRLYLRYGSDARVHAFETAIAALEDETLARCKDARLDGRPARCSSRIWKIESLSVPMLSTAVTP